MLITNKLFFAFNNLIYLKKQYIIMKKILLSFLLTGSFVAADAQVTIFEDSFETYPEFTINGFGGWSVLDLDGLATYIGGRDETNWQATWPNAGAPQAYMVFNPLTATGLIDGTTPTVGVTNNATGTPENRNFDPRTGLKYAAAWGAVPVEGGGQSNSDWLISPLIALGTSNNELTFYTKSLSDSYGLEKFRVGVFVGTGMPTQNNDFAVISGLGTLTAPYNSWGLTTLSLGNYNNQTVRIGIRYVSADVYMFMVDDFKITSSALGTNDVLASKFSTFPNPVSDILSLTSGEGVQISKVEITDLNGRVIKTVNYSDTVSEIQINVADLAAGMYLVNVNSAEGTATKKILKK